MITASLPVYALPAFPDAQGFGSDTPGGRTGRAIAVTTLEDSGTGSLREALAATGPRTIVFRVGGEIRLKSKLPITEPFVTLAGQTAPGTGIVLRNGGIDIETHDVIIRFIRCRGGLPPLALGGHADVHNIVVDHCSFSCAAGTCVSVGGSAHDVTMCWNIISASPGQGGLPGPAILLGEGSDHGMLHHNLIALCASGIPAVLGGRHSFANNVVYGWGSATGSLAGKCEVNFIGNLYKPGPATRLRAATTQPTGGGGCAYVDGNHDADPFEAVAEWPLVLEGPMGSRQSNRPFEPFPMHAVAAEEAYESVLDQAGALWPERDTFDLGLVRDARLGQGARAPSAPDIGRVALREPIPASPDADGDGMPDGWERACGFDPADAQDAHLDALRDGYTNLEHYLNALVTEAARQRPEMISLIDEHADAAEPPIQLMANGTSLPLVHVGTRPETYYAHVWNHDAGLIQAQRRLLAPTQLSLLPIRYQQEVTTSPGRIEFMAGQFGTRIITWGDAPDSLRLFLFLDPSEDDQAGDRRLVIDARDYGVTYGRSNATLRLQSALNDCARRGGGVVMVPYGDHDITTLRIPAKVTLRLERSAALYAVGEPDSPAAILIDGVQDAGLAGPGVVDGRASAGARRSPLVLIRNAQSVHIRDLIIRDPAGAGLVLSRCDGVDVINTKIITASARESTGGMSIDGSRHVTCERCLICANGDALTIQSDDQFAAAQPATAIRVRDTMLVPTRQGITFGPPNHQPITDCVFESVDIVNAAGGIFIRQQSGAGISGLAFRDLVMNLRPSKGDPVNGSPFFIVSNPAEGAAAIHDLVFDRLTTNVFTTMRLTGLGVPMADIRLEGLRLHVEGKGNGAPTTSLLPSLLTIQHAEHVRIGTATIVWPTNQEQCWKGILSSDQVKDLTFDPAQVTERVLPAGTQPAS